MADDVQQAEDHEDEDTPEVTGTEDVAAPGVREVEQAGDHEDEHTPEVTGTEDVAAPGVREGVSETADGSKSTPSGSGVEGADVSEGVGQADKEPNALEDSGQAAAAAEAATKPYSVEEKRAKFRVAFDMMDSDSNGSLDASEVAAATGMTVEQAEASFVNSVGSDGKVTFEQYAEKMGIDTMPDEHLDQMVAGILASLGSTGPPKNIYSHKPLSPPAAVEATKPYSAEEKREKFRIVFDTMDSNSNGSLDTSEVAAATGLTVEQAEGSFVNSVGSDGKVTFEQFVQAMTLGSGGIDSMPDSALDIMIADMMAKLKANSHAQEADLVEDGRKAAEEAGTSEGSGEATEEERGGQVAEETEASEGGGQAAEEAEVPEGGEQAAEGKLVPPLVSPAMSRTLRSPSQSSVKYKHLYGTKAKQSETYFNLKPAHTVSMDTPLLATNGEYWAAPWVGGGGPVYCSKISSTGKVEPHCATLNGSIKLLRALTVRRHGNDLPSQHH